MNSSSRSHFSLTGPSITLDPRVHAVRGDLADIALAGQLFAPHYAVPMPKRCGVISTMTYASPSHDGKATSQLLFGEDFMAIDMSGGWTWGYCSHDHYVGYVPSETLVDSVSVSSAPAIVSVISASLYAKPDRESEIVGTLPMGASVSGERDGDFIETSLGYVRSKAVGGSFDDFAAAAELLIDTPYVWGGRCGSGIDCSGLVQLALALKGVTAPRDSDQQQEAIGNDIPAGAALQRNDVIFFPGHVGIMADSETLLHATMHYGKTVLEPLEHTIARIAKDHDVPVLARKRIA